MRIALVTLGFCNSRLLSAAWTRLYETLPEEIALLGQPAEHWFCYNHYPIREKENEKELRALCERYGVKWWDSLYDRGLHKSYNYWAFNQGFKEDDIVVGLDPDVQAPLTKGWLRELVDVASRPDIALVSLDHPAVDRWKEGAANGLPKMTEERTPGGTRYHVHPSVEMWSLAALNWGFVEAIGGLDEPHGYYGGLEAHLYQRWKALGKKLAYLVSHREGWEPWPAGLIDPVYQEYKHAHLGGFKGSLKEYLEAKRPELLA